MLYLQELLADTLQIQAARNEVLDRTLEAAFLGARLGESVRAWLAELPSDELASRLIGGIDYRELPFKSHA